MFETNVRWMRLEILHLRDQIPLLEREGYFDTADRLRMKIARLKLRLIAKDLSDRPVRYLLG